MGTENRRRTALTIALVAVASAAAYSNSIRNAFQFRDAETIEENAFVRSLAYVPRYFVDPTTLTSDPSQTEYRPLLQVSYAFNYAISGYDPWSWHAANLALHVGAAVALFFVARMLLGMGRLTEFAGMSDGEGEFVSSAAALLFAIHPLATHAVEYLSARWSLIQGFLLLLATPFFLASLREVPRLRGSLPVLLLFAGALLSGPEAIGWVGLVVAGAFLLDPAQRGRSALARLGSPDPWLRILPFLLVAAAYGGLRRIVLPEAPVGDEASREGPLLAGLLTQLRAGWHGIAEFLAPVRLVADDPTFPVSRSILEGRALWALTGWLAASAFILRAARPAPAAAFLGAAIPVLFLLPWLLSRRLEPTDDARLYLPLAPLAVLAALALTRLARLVVADREAVVAGACAAVLAPLGWMTYERNAVWREPSTFWRDAVAKAPASARAHHHLGLVLAERGEGARALECLREAVWLDPADAAARADWGAVLVKRGDVEQGLAEFARAVAGARNDARPYRRRADAFLALGRLPEAIADYRAACDLALHPADSLESLAEAFARAGLGSEAGEALAQSLQREPDRWRAVYRLANPLLDSGKPEVALPLFETGRRGHPREAGFARGLGLCLHRLGRHEEAIQALRRALELAPDAPSHHTDLAAALLAAGQRAEAKRVCLEVSRRWPGEPEAKRLLVRLSTDDTES